MKTFAYDFILPFFINKDKFRPHFEKIHCSDEGFCYATNSHVLIKVPADNCMFKYDAVPNYPAVESVFKQYEQPNSAVIKLDELVKVTSLFKWVRPLDSDICQKCKGTGVISCECCGQDTDCKDCNGNGKHEKGTVELSLLVCEDYNSLIKIHNKYFKPDYAHIVAVCAMALGVNEVTLLYNDNKFDPHIFIVGDAQILVMPKQHDSESQVLTLKIS